MNETTSLDPPTDDASAHKAQADHYLAEMERLQRQMQSDRQEVQTLQAETRTIIADIMHTLRAA